MSYIELLTDADIDFGKKLWQSLRGNPKFQALGAFWLFEPETGRWHLVIASPRVDVLGPRDAYRELAEVTRSLPANPAQLLKIELISSQHPLYQALRSVFGQTASVEGARLGNTNVAGMYVDDAYLYGVQ